MRRLAPQTVDELRHLLRILLTFRKGDGDRLPGYAESILVVLAMQPEGEIRMGDLQGELGLRQARTSRLCMSLERAGLVDIRKSTEDRRSSAVKLTAAGNRLIDRTLSAYRSHAG